MPLSATTHARLDHVLATGQRDHRLPSVAAGLVRGGELVWSGAVGTVDGRRGWRSGRRRHAVPDGVDHQDIRRGRRDAAARRGPHRPHRPSRQARARQRPRRRDPRAAPHPLRRRAGRDRERLVGADSGRRLGRPRRVRGRLTLPSRPTLPLLQHGVCRPRSPPRGGPGPSVVRRRALRDPRAPRHDADDASSRRRCGTGLCRAPVRGRAAARARARRRRDGTRRSALDDRRRPVAVGRPAGWAGGATCSRPRPSPRWSSRTTSSTSPGSRGPGRTVWGGRCGTSRVPAPPATEGRCRGSWRCSACTSTPTVAAAAVRARSERRCR